MILRTKVNMADTDGTHCGWFDVCGYGGVRIILIILWNCVHPILIMHNFNQHLKLEHYMC